VLICKLKICELPNDLAQEHGVTQILVRLTVHLPCQAEEVEFSDQLHQLLGIVSFAYNGQVLPRSRCRDSHGDLPFFVLPSYSGFKGQAEQY
jgi:hypothetical protein